MLRALFSLLFLLASPARLAAAPADPLFQEQTNLHEEGVDALGAWKITRGGGAVICVLDDGIDWLHDELVHAFALNAGELPLVPLGADGVLGVEDFAGMVTDTNGNGIVDVPDLLAAYSDGVDNDGNGYVDDISGWDFDDNDNDAHDLWYDGHGTGRAGILAAAENGAGPVGAAPEAHLLVARVGDKILHTPDTLAEAVAYCADNGADSINMSLGGMGGSSTLRAAFRYALDQGVVSANTSGNEGHHHHNFNAVLDDVVAVGSVIEGASAEGPWTEKNNTTDYGAKLELAAPTDSWTVAPFTGNAYRREGGTSSATPHVAAGAALLAQAARDRGIALTARERRHLLRGTAADIQRTKWQAAPGWDPMTGYGRVNFKAAIARLLAGDIPAEADLREPNWFEVVNPRERDSLPVRARIASRTGAAAFVLRAGAGVNPETWETVAEGTVDGPFEGDLLHAAGRGQGLKLSDLVPLRTDPLGELGNPQSFAVTLHLAVTPLDEHGRKLEKRSAEDRQTFYVVNDQDALPGFPLQNTASVEAAILAADLDADGKSEIVIADSDGVVKALRADGSVLWRASTLPFLRHPDAPAFRDGKVQAAGEPILGSPAAADLDGDGRPEVVAAGLNGHLYAWRNDGKPFWPAPLTTDTSRYPGETNTRARVYGNIVLADLDADGRPEIVAVAQDQQLYAWHGDGRRVKGFPVFLSVAAKLRDVAEGTYRPSPVVSTPAIVDLDGDGQVDIVVGTNEIDRNFFGRIYAVDGRGNSAPGGPFLQGWPVATVVSPVGLPVIGEGVSGGITAADLDGDGRPEVIGGGFTGNAAIWNHDGTLRALLERNYAQFGAFSNVGEPVLAGWTNALPTVGDLDGDGSPEIYAAGMGLGTFVATMLTEKKPNGSVPDTNHLMLGYRADGSFLPHFPRRLEGWSILTNPLLVDVDGDATPEIVAGSSGYYLHAYKQDGTEPRGWPKFTGGLAFRHPGRRRLVRRRFGQHRRGRARGADLRVAHARPHRRRSASATARHGRSGGLRHGISGSPNGRRERGLRRRMHDGRPGPAGLVASWRVGAPPPRI